MPGEQIDIFRPSETEKQEMRDKIYHAITAANQRIDGAITEGHLKSMLISVLEHEVVMQVTGQAQLEIDLSIQAADGNRNKIDYQLLAAKLADTIDQHG
ncbi:MAG: hypothetical protein WC544_01240 [Patescibacteria group bacterium]